MTTSKRNDKPRATGEHRLFLALLPSDEVRAGLVAAVDGCAALRDVGRKVLAEKWHITLHFLGAAPDEPAAMIDQVRGLAPRIDCSAFHLVIDRAGGFRGSGVAWVAPAGNSGLDALWSDLGRALDDAGVARRAHETFSPHVTVRRSLRGTLAETQVEPVSWPVDDFVLMHSHGGRYDVIDRWPLRPA